MFYFKFIIKVVQYGIESEDKVVVLYICEMELQGISFRVDEVGFFVFKEKFFFVVSIDRIIINFVINEKWGMEN